MIRVRSAQKLPRLSPRLAAKARARAAATAMPAAAEAKFCTVRPAIWAKWLSGALAGVELPVGVGDEADGGVERQVRGHAGEPLRVQRQMPLQAQDGVEEQERRGAEGEERDRIGEPALAFVGPDPHEGVVAALNRLQNRIEPGALALPDPGHIDAERPAEAHGEADRQGDLGPSLNIHFAISLFLELVWAKQRHEHVAGDGDRAGAVEEGDEHGQTPLSSAA